MTREEAQSSLANLKRYMSGGGAVDRKANEAINMAIKALEQLERKVQCNFCNMSICTLEGRPCSRKVVKE